MLGLELPDVVNESTKLFLPNVINNGSSWQPWYKPRNARLIFTITVGPGGTGGNGGTGTTGGGGGGGGPGGMHILVVPLFAIPEMLWVSVPAGNSGSKTAIAPTPMFSTNVLTLASAGQNGGGGSGAGSAGAGSSPGSGAGGSSYSMWDVGIGYLPTGSNGANGGAGAASAAAGNNITPSGLILTGGAGGAGCNTGPVNNAGGNITAPNPGWEPLIASILGGIAGGGAGAPGSSRLRAGAFPFCCTGGAGGGSNSAGTGGKGGDGGYGCGGGGGGGGTTGGAGGKGGDGFVLITAI